MEVNWYEVLGAVTGVACVWLTVRENVWCWPVGLINAAMYLVVFLQARLYGNMGLQVFFIVLQFYGWYEWLYGGERHSGLAISRASTRIRASSIIVAACGAGLMGFVLQRGTDAALPYWDSGATVLSIVAQWMLARKFLENWIGWIIVDVVTIGLGLSQRLYLTALLYAVFLTLATLGYFEWRKKLNAQQPA